MLRDIERQPLTAGMYIRTLVRLTNQHDKPLLLTAVNNHHRQTVRHKRIKHLEELDAKTTLLVYHAPTAYNYNHFRDFLTLLDDIHQSLKETPGYFIDFITTNRGDLDFSLVGSKHYIDGDLQANYYKVHDSLLTTLTFYNHDAFIAAEKYKYLRDFLPKF